MYFPTGMSTITVSGYLSGANGKPKTGHIKVYAERKVFYQGTDWMMDESTEWFPTKQGFFSVTVPHSDQTGLIGDDGAPITNLGYKIVFRPLQSTVVLTKLWRPLPMSLGAVVNLSQLQPIDLGGWPHQTVIVNPPGGGGGDGTFVRASGYPATTPGFWVPST